MTQKELLVGQTRQVHQWLWTLIDDVPDDKWLSTPPVIESNIHWQVGHLLITHFYHSIVLLKAPKNQVVELIPITVYYPIFAAGSIPKNDSQIPIGELKGLLKKVHHQELNAIEELTENDFVEPLFPTQFPHPVAKTKLDAICWDINHTMWHCGQIALIKRVVDKRFYF